MQAEDSVDNDVLNSYCWMYSSFDVADSFSFPCTRKNYEGSYLYNTYYQWVSIFLAFLAGLFYIPRCIWLIIEGGLMSYMVKGRHKFLAIPRNILKPVVTKNKQTFKNGALANHKFRIRNPFFYLL